MVHPRKFVRDSLSVALSQYLARAVILARGLVAARALGPRGFGGWNALSLIFDYGSYASFGALQGLDLRLPAPAAEGDAARARRLMAAAWSVVLAGGALFGAGLALYLATGGKAFSALPGAGLPLLMLAAALLQLAFQYVTSSLRAHGFFHAVSAGYAVQAVLGGGLGLALVWPYGAWGLLAGWIAGTLTALAWMWRAGVAVPLVPAHLREGLSLAGAGVPIFGYFAATLVMRSVDRLALVRYAGAEPLGLYSLGLMAAGLLLHLPEAAAYVLFPRIAAAFHGAGDRERARTDALKTHRSLAVIIPLLAGLGVVWAGPIVTLLLPAYRGGLAALRILSLGAIMLSAATMPGYYLLAAGRQRLLMAVGALAALVNATLVFSVAARDPRPEAVAAAASTGYFLFAVAAMVLAARAWFESAGARVWLVAATVIPAVWGGGAAFVLCALGFGDSWAGALWRTAVLLIAYTPVLAWLGRGAGLATLAREWLAARSSAAPQA
jgi:O-antigen/teichoic acid export membrane protein